MGFIDDAKDNLTHAVDDVKDKAQDVGGRCERLGWRSARQT